MLKEYLFYLFFSIICEVFETMQYNSQFADIFLSKAGNISKEVVNEDRSVKLDMIDCLVCFYISI